MLDRKQRILIVASALLCDRLEEVLITGPVLLVDLSERQQRL